MPVPAGGSDDFRGLATLDELAAELEQDVADLDATKGTQKILWASAAVEAITGLAFTPRTATVRLPSTADNLLHLPLQPLRSVVSATIDGTAYADHRITADGAIWRARSWRTAYWPQTVEVTATYGFEVVPDDIKGVVLEMAAAAYDGRIAAESIDDYRVQFAAGSSALSTTAEATLAAYGAGARALAMRGR